MTNEPLPFTEIGTASNFSFLRGASHPEELARAAQALGLAGIGLADRNTVAGVVRLHLEAKRLGLAFRPGARLVLADGTPDLLAYPVNRRGWGHLCRLLSAGNLRAKKGECLLTLEDVLAWQEDLLVAAVPGRTGFADLSAHLARLKEALGDRLHLALAPRYDGEDRFAFAALAQVAEKTGVPLLASNLPLYHVPERRPLADVVTAIREHVPVQEAGFRLAANAERHLKGAAEMAWIFRDYPQAIAKTTDFFSRLHFSLDELRYQYPDESRPGETVTQTLERLTHEGAARRFPGGVPEKVSAQIAYELALIREKRYEPYFLTVYNIMQHARSRNILCQGRGSAANSTVCYCLGITEVNPEMTSLLFARFISTERDEPPDIDVDFEHEKREEVIRHIYETYGRDRAGLTAAVASYRTRSAGREVAKAFGLPEDVQSALSGTVWGSSSTPLSEAEAKRAGLDTQDATVAKVLRHARKLIGFPRHLTQHVGGFVITRDRLDEVVPIMPTAMEGRSMIEWNKDDLDALGILKIDILALGMLTCLARAFRLLETEYGVVRTLADLGGDIRDEVYDMICRADTIGVFQIESRAQMSMLPRLRPRTFYDLVIEVAIVRPGPIQGNMVHPYLKRREAERKGQKLDYPYPELQPVLGRTLGVPLFQEQAMQIAITAAGFSPGEADRLRRSMAAFRRSGTVSEFRKKMIDGMETNGYPREFAENCFSQIEGFGEYGFPESHAASFALLVYASAWIKAFYPDVFCAALLNSQPMGFYSPSQLVRDAREHGVEVRPPDVNLSARETTLEAAVFDAAAIHRRHGAMRGAIRTQKALRLGLDRIRGFSEQDADRLLGARGEGYRSVRDLWLRSGLSRAGMERLAEADAFGSLGLTRRQALWAVRGLDGASAAERLPLFTRAGADDLQREPQAVLPVMGAGEEVVEDYRSLTLSLKAHPVSFLRQRLAKLGVTRNIDLDAARNGAAVTVAGLVLVRQRPGSARGVIFLTLEDETGTANAIVWPKIFDRFRPVVMGARLILIRGRLQAAEGVIHVVANHIADMSGSLSVLLDGEENDDRQENERKAARVMPGGRNFH